MIVDLLRKQIANLRAQGLYRQREAADESKIKIHFSCNDYLSLRHDPRVQHAFQQGFRHYPVGSGASMTVAGYHAIHRELEQAFARHLGVEDALLFSSGYAANLGIISMLASLGCHLFIDKAVHASMYDGITLAGAKFTRFLHNNLTDLSQKLASVHQHAVVMTEGIFSMSGQQPDLSEMIRLCRHYQAVCIVDEAHAFGVLGPKGLGSVALFGADSCDVPLRAISFGKSMGFQGAVVAGQAEWIDGIVQMARSHRYSTAISPALAYGLLESLSIIMQADEARERLAQHIAYFKQHIECSPLLWRKSNSPIQQLQLGCPHKALEYSLQLKMHGIHCQAMRAPTVSPRDTGLRVVLNAAHTRQNIDSLFQQLHCISHDASY